MTDQNDRGRDTEILTEYTEDIYNGLLSYGPDRVIANARAGGHEFLQSRLLDTGELVTIKFSVEITGAKKP